MSAALEKALEAGARVEAEWDSRDFDALGQTDKARYLARFTAAYDAAAALASISSPDAPGGVEVKPLEWRDERNCECSAETIVGMYEVGFDDGWWAHLEGGVKWDWEPDQDPRSYHGPDAAKAAAQADYERRIRSALVTAPPPADAGVVTEAARLRKALEFYANPRNWTSGRWARGSEEDDDADEPVANLICIDRQIEDGGFAIPFADCGDRARKALAALASAAPSGWRASLTREQLDELGYAIVPKEPTEVMLNHPGVDAGARTMRKAWASMLAAAPPSPISTEGTSTEGGECENCHDSGYVECTSGGTWTGEGIKSSLSFCECECGIDARKRRTRP